MPISQRKFLAFVGEYHDAGSQGQVDSTYLIKSSGDATVENMWWCAKSTPSGREATVGMKAEHRVDAVFEFSAECPVDFDDAILCDGESYWVRAVLGRDYGQDAVQVLAERDPDLTLTSE